MGTPPAQCRAKTKKTNKRCRNNALEGTDRCGIHTKGAVLQLVPGGATDENEVPVVPAKDDPGLGPNERALLRTLRALGREEDEYAAGWQMLRSLARAVDTAPTRAALWAEYREALNDLKKEAADGDKALREALEALENASK